MAECVASRRVSPEPHRTPDMRSIPVIMAAALIMPEMNDTPTLTVHSDVTFVRVTRVLIGMHMFIWTKEGNT